MQLSHLLERLSEDSITRLALADPEADVYTVAFLTPAMDGLREDVLYFGDTTLLAGIPLPDSPNLVLYGSGDLHALAQSMKHANIVELADAADPYQCFNLIQSYFLEDQEQTAIIRRMLSAHFSNGGLQYLIEEAAMALGNPLVVVDTTFRYIAHHLASLEAANSTLARVMNEEVHSGAVLDDAVSYIREQRIDSELAELGRPLVRHNEILDCNTMTGAVMVRGVCIAHVMMMEHGRPFTNLDYECFDRLLSFVGQEMQKNEVWGPTSGEMGSYFLANLLSDRHPSESITQRRMKTLDFHPKPVFHVVCFHTSGEGLRQAQIEYVAGQIRPILHHALYTRFHGNCVVLISRDAEDELDQTALPLIGEVASLNNLSVGISNAFERITDVRGAYDQARAAIRLGELTTATWEERGLYHYRDYAYLRVLELGNRHANLMSCCHPALLRLAAHDRKHDGELLETLYCYLQVSGVTKRAAEMLSLHKNTLLYRVNRIKEILGMDLSSGEDIFLLQFSFRILIFLGVFSPRVTTTREGLRQ